jgi:hypothetical protein
MAIGWPLRFVQVIDGTGDFVDLIRPRVRFRHTSVRIWTGGWPAQRGFRCVGMDAAEVSGLVQASLRNAIHVLGHALFATDAKGWGHTPR